MKLLKLLAIPFLLTLAFFGLIIYNADTLDKEIDGQE